MKTCTKCGEQCEVGTEIGAGRARVCHACQRESKREATRRRRATPEGRAHHARVNREWRARHPEDALAAQRRWREKVYANPETRAQYLDHQRIYHRIWRERKGTNVRPISEEVYIDRYGHGWSKASLLPADPLRELVEQELRRLTKDELAALAGVPERRLYGLIVERAPRVSLTIADRLCMAMNIPLSVVYPEAS